MRNSLFKKSLLLLVIAFSMLSPFYAMAECNKANETKIVLYNASGQQHYAIASFSVSKHANQDGYDNSLKVGCHVKYKRVVDGAKFWYEETYASASDKTSVSKKQTLTPLIHELMGAEGSWDVTCNYCEVGQRRNTGVISYKSVTS